jgi:hypothetical protein
VELGFDGQRLQRVSLVASTISQERSLLNHGALALLELGWRRRHFEVIDTMGAEDPERLPIGGLALLDAAHRVVLDRVEERESLFHVPLLVPMCSPIWIVSSTGVKLSGRESFVDFFATREMTSYFLNCRARSRPRKSSGKSRTQR